MFLNSHNRVNNFQIYYNFWSSSKKMHFQSHIVLINGRRKSHCRQTGRTVGYFGLSLFSSFFSFSFFFNPDYRSMNLIFQEEWNSKEMSTNESRVYTKQSISNITAVNQQQFIIFQRIACGHIFQLVFFWLRIILQSN